MTTSGHFTAYSPAGGTTIGEGIATVTSLLMTAGASGVKVAVNPATLLSMQLVKASTSGVYLGMPPGIVMPTIVPSASVAVGKLLAWADTGTVWANREGVSVEAGLNADDFTRNKVTLLAEHRGAVLTLNASHVLWGNASA